MWKKTTCGILCIMLFTSGLGGDVPSQTMEHQEMGVDGQQRDPDQLEDFIRVSRQVIQRELQERCFDPKISNSRLVQVYVSTQSEMDTHEVLQHQYITTEILYKTYIRESNNVLKGFTESRRWSSLSEKNVSTLSVSTMVY
jgi:hypothetical protein